MHSPPFYSACTSSNASGKSLMEKDDQPSADVGGGGDREGVLTTTNRPSFPSSSSLAYAVTAAPSFSHSQVLSRLSTSPTLLPENLASLITAISLAARFSIRASALFIEAILESARYLSVGGLGITRRALLSAVGSARAIHYVNQKLNWTGRNEEGERTNDVFLQVLDKYTNVGVYLIHHTFSLAELFALSGFYLTLSTIQTGFAAAEESVRMIDMLFGSTETSRALSSIITLVRQELTQDSRFSPAERGAIASLTSLTKTLTAFVMLQMATHKRTLKEMRMRVIYDCTIVVEQAQKEYSMGSVETPSRPTPPQFSEHEHSHRRARSESSESELLVNEVVRSGVESSAGSPRTRTTSIAEESVEIVEALEEYCVDDGEHGDETSDLPDEVVDALRRVQSGQFRAAGAGGKGKLVDFEIEVEETTTTTTTILRALDPRSRDRTPKTISRNTIPKPTNSIEEDEWEELVGSRAGSRSTSVRGEVDSDGDETFEDASDIPSAANGASTLASTSRQQTLENPKESRERLQLVLRTMTKKFTQRKRTVRRIETPSRGNSPARSSSRSKSVERANGKHRKRDVRAIEWPSSEAGEGDDTEVERSPKLKSSSGVLRALGKALKKPTTTAGEFFSPSRSSSSTSVDKLRSLDSSPHPPVPPVPPLPPTAPSSPKRHSATLLNPTSVLPPVSVPPRLRRQPSTQSMRSVVTTFTTHASAAPVEEPEPKASNFPHRHLVENLQYFMRSSSASYGQTFLRILGIGKHDFNFPNTQTHANNHAFAHHVGIHVDDILLSSFTDTSAGWSTVKMSPIVNFIAVDHSLQAIVLSCRGSLGLSDILTDLTCDYQEIHVEHGTPGGSYYVHSGMYSAALMLRQGTVRETIREALERYPSYGLVLCGHSLGGGVAALLSIIWSSPRAAFESQTAQLKQTTGRKTRHPPISTPFVTSFSSGLPPGRPISCFCFGPPSVASPDLARYCRGLVTSTVHNHDLIPTLSLGVFRDLKNMAMGLSGEAGTAEEIVGRVIGLWQRRFMANRSSSATGVPKSGADVDSTSSLTEIADEAREVPLSNAEIDAGRGSNKALDPSYRDPSLMGPEVSDDEELQTWLWSLVKTMRAGNDSAKLYPPGDVYIIESWTVFISESSDQRQSRQSSNAKFSRREGRRVVLRVVDDVERRFSEPIFGRSMMSDHSPRSYEQSLDDLATAVVG